ncbi:MAG: aminoacyl-tRNA hydrolase [bacterium]|nr:MAG: aminoacyl-tRNA hydrolase [bacterium]
MSDVSFLLGLGNPGDSYSGTRHNLGKRTLDLLAAKHDLTWSTVSGTCVEARYEIGDRVVLLVKPLIYMNESGRALGHYDSIDSRSLLVICDDINLPLGRLRLRERGGSGGHRGIESVAMHLGTDDFPRLRMGIGPAPPGEDWSDYVLSPFLAEEREDVEQMIATAALALELIIREGLEAAMQTFNRKDPPQSSP